jgi:hypothetical protein
LHPKLPQASFTSGRQKRFEDRSWGTNSTDLLAERKMDQLIVEDVQVEEQVAELSLEQLAQVGGGGGIVDMY